MKISKSQLKQIIKEELEHSREEIEYDSAGGVVFPILSEDVYLQPKRNGETTFVLQVEIEGMMYELNAKLDKYVTAKLREDGILRQK